MTHAGQPQDVMLTCSRGLCCVWVRKTNQHVLTTTRTYSVMTDARGTERNAECTRESETSNKKEEEVDDDDRRWVFFTDAASCRHGVQFTKGLHTNTRTKHGFHICRLRHLYRQLHTCRTFGGAALLWDVEVLDGMVVVQAPTASHTWVRNMR